MDYSCCAAIKVVLPAQINEGLSKGDNGFLGGIVGPSLRKKFGIGTRILKNFCGKRSRNSNSGVAFSVLTRDINKEMVPFESSSFVEDRPMADPTSVASIILGGGAGTRLFPLTSRRAKPADAKNKKVENILILSGDHLYRMDYMEFIQKHIDTNADITVSCVPMDDRAYIVHFAEKPKGSALKEMQVDSSSRLGQDYLITRLKDFLSLKTGHPAEAFKMELSFLQRLWLRNYSLGCEGSQYSGDM